MHYTKRIEQAFKAILPSPFTIAILLTLVTTLAAGALLLGRGDSLTQLPEMWYKGLWGSGGMVFMVQMMLMLVLGHILALSKPVDYSINKLLQYCGTNIKAVTITAILALLASWFNWGLGLIVGAIMARKCAEYLSQKGVYFNYPLLAAAGYSGLMVWHGGLSGSSLIKVAEPGHIQDLLKGSNIDTSSFPSVIGMGNTVFSGINILIFLLAAVCIVVALKLMAKNASANLDYLKGHFKKEKEEIQEKTIGVGRLDSSKVFIKLIGVFVVAVALSQINGGQLKALTFITPNFINTFLLGLGLIFHDSLLSYSKALNNAIGGSAGILLQFPLYFGIMGLMKESGLVIEMAEFFIEISTPTTLPLFTFMSAGLVNFFVPSGGGQWLIQGPIVLQSCKELGVPLEKGIMALAYGDQITNMLQPFWALPLLGITGVKARDMLPYTFVLFLIGSVIYMLGLLL